MFKKIRNRKRTGNKVSARYKYVSNKADWIYENTLERFDFAVKRRFGKKQDTTHFVFSFSRLLADKKREKARELISNFFFNRFGTEYYLSVAEHNDNGKTHYHILLSRNLTTGRMLHLTNKEYMQLVKEINNVMSELMNDYEIEVKNKYSTGGEITRQFGYFEYSNYKEIKQILDRLDTKKKVDFILSLLPNADSSKDSYKAITRAVSELVSELLNNAEIELLNSFLEQAGVRIFLETTQKGRERIKISFTKNFEFLKNAKTTTFRISNLNRNIANELKKQLKELQNGITRIDTNISREVSKVEREISILRTRNTRVRELAGKLQEISKLFNSFRKFEFREFRQLENRLENRFTELKTEFREFEREIERARRISETTAITNTITDTADKEYTEQDSKRDRRTQELSIYNNDNSVNTDTVSSNLHNIVSSQKDISLGGNEMISLEYAKQHINLVELAINKFGYKIDKRKSSRYYKTLKKNSDVIIVKRNSKNNHFVYFNAHNESDSGTIIDFLQNRGIGNLGQVRRFLSEYLKEKKEGKIKTVEDFEVRATSISDNQNEVLREYSRLREITEDNYLTKDRLIDYSLIERNKEHIFTDDRNNAVFLLHNNRGELIGLAKYNRRKFKQIVGEKGIWTSAIGKEDIDKIEKIVITESPIDALSYLELKEDINKAFLISTQGQISDKTIDYVYSYIKAIYNHSKKKLDIVLAFDNDQVGLSFTEKMREELSKRLEKNNIKVRFIIDLPSSKDWNDELKNKKLNINKVKEKKTEKKQLLSDEEFKQAFENVMNELQSRNRRFRM